MINDTAGNPIWREDLQTGTHSETYAYDDASRLTEFKRGTMNGSHVITSYTSDASLIQRNAWTLDKLGNWDELVKRTGKKGTFYFVDDK